MHKGTIALMLSLAVAPALAPAAIAQEALTHSRKDFSIAPWRSNF